MSEKVIVITGASDGIGAAAARLLKGDGHRVVIVGRRCSPVRAYGKTKLMNILFAKGLHQRFHPSGLAAAAFHPGVVRTSFSTEFGGTLNLAYTSLVKHLFRSPVKGAETLVWLATTTPGSDWQSGAFYNCLLYT